jgi:hypothetical protein
MATSLQINSVEKSQLVDWKSLQREMVLTKEPDKLRFLVRKHAGQTYKPEVGDEVVLTVNSIKEFGGFVVEVREVIDGLLEGVECICKDYTHTLDRNLVAITYTGQTVNQIIDSLLSTFATGFTDNNVNCPIVIDKVIFNYLPISKCLEKLTDLVGDYEWYVDYDKDIHFFASSAESASFGLTDTSGNYVFNSLEIKEDTHQLRNEIIIRGGLLTSSTARTEYMSGDGTKDVYPLATKFSALPTVAIGGSTITVGIENLDPAGYQAYWNYNEKSLKFITAPTAGTSNITASTTYEYPLILQKRSEASITNYGVFQFVIVDKNIRDLETASLRADAEIIRYAIPSKSANFKTYTYGLRAGQTINIQSTIRGYDTDFKIQMIRSRLKTPHTDELVHDVEAVTADDVGINDILAKLLITNPSDQIEIQQDEVVERIRQLEDDLGITDSVPTGSYTEGPYLYDDADSLWGFSTWS